MTDAEWKAKVVDLISTMSEARRQRENALIHAEGLDKRPVRQPAELSKAWNALALADSNLHRAIIDTIAFVGGEP